MIDNHNHLQQVSSGPVAPPVIPPVSNGAKPKSSPANRPVKRTTPRTDSIAKTNGSSAVANDTSKSSENFASKEDIAEGPSISTVKRSSRTVKVSPVSTNEASDPSSSHFIAPPPTLLKTELPLIGNGSPKRDLNKATNGNSPQRSTDIKTGVQNGTLETVNGSSNSGLHSNSKGSYIDGVERAKRTNLDFLTHGSLTNNLNGNVGGVIHVDSAGKPQTRRKSALAILLAGSDSDENVLKTTSVVATGPSKKLDSSRRGSTGMPTNSTAVPRIPGLNSPGLLPKKFLPSKGGTEEQQRQALRQQIFGKFTKNEKEESSTSSLDFGSSDEEIVESPTFGDENNKSVTNTPSFSKADDFKVYFFRYRMSSSRRR